jgi:hypothetical protein
LEENLEVEAEDLAAEVVLEEEQVSDLMVVVCVKTVAMKCLIKEVYLVIL